jgi:lysylphosphatidylglycerol synthetase-like protein (DUF2156 family)
MIADKRQLLPIPLDTNNRLSWLAKAHGPYSHMILYPAKWRFFKHQHGVIPWIENPGTAIVWSDPLTDRKKTRQVLESFTNDMKAQKRSTCLFVIDEATAREAMGLGYSVYKVGEIPWFDLATWQIPKGNRGKNLRWCLNHARKSGVTVVEYRPGIIRNIRYETSIRNIMENWGLAQKKKVVSSIMKPAPLEAIGDKRIFIAMRGETPLAFLACSPIYGVDGFYLEDIVRSTDHINGTCELLIVEALGALRKSGFSRAALGIAPMRGRAQQMDRRARWISPIVSLAVFFMSRFYPMEQLAKYPDKFGPSSWEGSCLAFRPVIPGPRLVYHIIKTMTG